MAPESRRVLFCLSLFLGALWQGIDGACLVPNHLVGNYYSIEQGAEQITTLEIDSMENNYFTGECDQLQLKNNSQASYGRNDATIIFKSPNCMMCVEIYYRTPNVLQYKSSDCINQIPPGWTAWEYTCGSILPYQQLYTMFRRNLETVNCKNTFEGVYNFAYEVNYGGGSVCSNERNQIVACQEPGSPYVDNQIMFMNFAVCPGVATSVNSNIRFQCMGTWNDPNGNIWSVLADTGQDEEREKYRCLLTRDDQQEDDNKFWHSMSRFSQCDTLNTPYDGDIRLELKPVVYGNQLVQPQCNLPRNFSGTWFTTGEFDSQVLINDTHIYFKTKLDQYTYRETYFTCQQSIDSRYLMTAVTVGKCEVDYICFDINPRHHSIIRWRMGRPFRMMLNEMNQPNFLERKFRQACSWNSFTIDRTKTDWTYNVFIMDPPSPVNCPVAGRFKFSQKGVDSEKYFTRVEGITERPRHQIDCMQYTSEFSSCAQNLKKINLDVEYCDTVDHTGRPIGEYDIPDNELACVGFWMEDMQSYMITYDEMDAVSPFRCWVYERLDWLHLIMSRSTRSICGKNQNARSYTPDEGASLAMELHGNERLFDDCPTRFNSGKDPYASELEIYVMGGSDSVAHSLLLTIIMLCTVLLLHR